MYRTVQPIGTACRSYYYLLVASDGMIWRYPGSGQLRTSGEGSCTEDWMP